MRWIHGFAAVLLVLGGCGGEPEPSGAVDSRAAERRVPLEGADNFRDLGGYASADGRRVRWGQVFRSGQLAELTDQDVAAVDGLGLRLVVDFRSPKEREAEPDRLPESEGLRVVNAAIHTPGVDPHDLREKILGGDLDDLDLSEWLVEANRAFATTFADRYRQMFDELLAPESLPAVVHCTAGKDRAGMGAALILLALGVSEETVMDDFLLTNHYRQQTIERDLLMIRLVSLFRTRPEQVRPLLGVEPRFLEAGLDAMRASHGSIDGYLREAMALDEARRERLRSLLLEPATS